MKEVKFELENYNRNVPTEDLLIDLKEVAKKLGKSPTIEEYNKFGKFHSTTLTRRLGNWYKTLEEAGLAATRSPINLSEEELFQNLEGVWRQLGRQPRYQEVIKPISKYSAATYENRFGSWRRSLEAFIEYINKEDGSYGGEITTKTTQALRSKHKTKRTVNWRLRFLVMKRDNFKCKLCGRSPAIDPSITLQVAHILAWSRGGETIVDNLQTLCSICNIGKSDLE